MATRSAGAAREGKLPLPDDFFHAPPLNAKETKYLVNLAKRACKEVVFYSRRTGGPMNWVHLSSDDGVEVFQGIDENATENKAITYLRGSTRIYATVDDVADFFRLDTPMKLSGFTQTVGKDLLDQKTLYDLALPSAENPKHYVGVKWTAVESPSKLARNRDFCYLECHDEFIDTNSKKRGWVRSIHSIRLPFCPPLDQSHGLVRGSLYRSGFVFIESDDKTYVDAVHTLHMDIKGNAPNWLKIMAMKRRIKNISEVNRYFQMRRLCEGRLLGDLELPSKSGVYHCQVCGNKFGLFSRKSACRKCGKVICTPCGQPFILDYAGNGAKKVKICAHCADRVVHGEEGSQDKPTSHIGAHRVDSQPKLIYDPSPASHGGRSADSRPRSTEDLDYYMSNEDARGIADIEEAKRMQQEFEDQFARSYGSTDATAQPPLHPSMAQQKPVGPARGSVRMSARQSNDIFDRFTVGDVRPSKKPEQPLSRRQSQPRMSAYQEFMQTERARQKSIAGGTVPPVVSSRQRPSAVNGARPSMLHTVGPPAPGEMLIRTRHEDAYGGQYSRETIELHRTLAPPPEDESYDAIQISSEWDPDLLSARTRLQRLRDNSSILSDDTVGAPIRRSDLSVGRSRLSSADNVHSSFIVPDEMTRRVQSSTLPPSFPSPTNSDTFSNGSPAMLRSIRHSHGSSQAPRSSVGYDFRELQRSYFDARNSEMNELQQLVQSQPTTDDEGDFRYGYDAESPASEDTDLYDKEYEVPLASASMIKRSRRKTVSGTENGVKRNPVEQLATVMALSAMQLYEKENGLDLQVSEETRQAALKKMIEIYSNEIERNSSEEKHRDARRGGRSASVTTPKTTEFQRSNRQHAHTMIGNTPQSPTSFMEYRDLSDLSASAFKAYQRGTLTSDDASHAHSDADPSLPSSVTGTSRRQASGPESKTSSRRNAPLGLSEAIDSMSRDAGTIRDSLPNSEGIMRPPSHPNSIHDDMSDTFSELDLIDLPHLIRADEATPSERNADRLSQDSHLTDFSEVSNGRLSTSIGPTTAQNRLSTSDGAVYASLHADPGLHSPPSAPRSNSISSQSDGGEMYDENDFTSRSKMTLTELERYRTSLAELMAEYDHEQQHSPARQPEGEHEPDQYFRGRASYKSANSQHNLDKALQELYL